MKNGNCIGKGKGKGGACRVLTFDLPRKPENGDHDLTMDLIDYRLDDFTPKLLEQYRKKIACYGLLDAGYKAEDYDRVKKWHQVLRDSLLEIGRILDAYHIKAPKRA